MTQPHESGALDMITDLAPVSDTQANTWLVKYYADNGTIFTRGNVKFYEIQDALMDLSRQAYENGTFAKRIEIV